LSSNCHNKLVYVYTLDEKYFCVYEDSDYMKILVVEDDSDIRELICQCLTQADYQVQSCMDVKSTRQLVETFRPDCLVVDWMLPDTSGVELIRWLRRQPDYAQIPCLMLTARSQETDKITGLESGADDYMTKPMSLRELKARIKALLRRPSAYLEASDLIIAGLIKLNLSSHEVEVAGQLVDLSPTEYKLLKFFMRNQNKVFSRDQILTAVWGDGSYISDRTVDVHILRLRKVLKRFEVDGMISTVRGSGYRFVELAR
jgi:two-component system phosphate regulon response regulator PhoB